MTLSADSANVGADVGRELPTLERTVADPGTQPLRVGVVGLGAVAQAVHLPLLAKHPELFRVSALCDLSPSACASLGERFGIDEARRYGSAEELLDAGELDAVAILTPGSHGRLAATAAAPGSRSSARSRWPTRSPRRTSSPSSTRASSSAT